MQSGSVSRRLSSTSSAAGAGGKPSANGEAGADVAEMEEADEANGVNGEEGGGWRSRLATVAGGKGDGSGNPLNPGALNGGMSTNLAATGLRSPQALGERARQGRAEQKRTEPSTNNRAKQHAFSPLPPPLTNPYLPSPHDASSLCMWNSRLPPFHRVEQILKVMKILGTRAPSECRSASAASRTTGWLCP